MAFTKFIYTVIGWLNKSESLTTPVGKRNLRHMDDGIKTIGDNLNAAYEELDAGKLDMETAYTMVHDVGFDERTGIFTVKKLNGSTFTIDTKLEKIATNWTFDKDSQQLILTLDDGTKQEVDLSALITQYEFLDSDTIAFTIGSDGKVSANVKDGSILEKHLQPNYLANIKTHATNASASAAQAADSADAADYDAKMAQSYAVGTGNMRDGESTDNAKYYKEQAEYSASDAFDYASNASDSSGIAQVAAETANKKASSAEASAANASTSESNANKYAANAMERANSANESAETASASAGTASEKADNAAASALQAESYAHGGTGTRANEETDNAMYYYQQSRAISESFSGALRPMGTVAFANLPSVSSAAEGDMYNVSDEFTTTADFKEGSGLTIPAGSNVYKTADRKWDILAGSPVTGVKGSAETEYQRGNVNITPESIGLGKVNNTSDLEKSVKYASSAGNAEKVNNHTVNADVPSNAKFTDTWRGVQDNLTSTSSTDSLSAKQGKVLDDKIDDVRDVLSSKATYKYLSDTSSSDIVTVVKNNWSKFESGVYLAHIETGGTTYMCLIQHYGDTQNYGKAVIYGYGFRYYIDMTLNGGNWIVRYNASDCGLTSSFTATKQACTDVTVNFNFTFPSTPRVVGTLYSSSSAYNFGHLTLAVKSVSTTGCVFRVFSADTESRTPNISWQAML